MQLLPTRGEILILIVFLALIAVSCEYTERDRIHEIQLTCKEYPKQIECDTVPPLPKE